MTVETANATGMLSSSSRPDRRRPQRLNRCRSPKAVTASVIPAGTAIVATLLTEPLDAVTADREGHDAASRQRRWRDHFRSTVGWTHRHCGCARGFAARPRPVSTTPLAISARAADDNGVGCSNGHDRPAVRLVTDRSAVNRWSHVVNRRCWPVSDRPLDDRDRRRSRQAATDETYGTVNVTVPSEETSTARDVPVLQQDAEPDDATHVQLPKVTCRRGIGVAPTTDPVRRYTTSYRGAAGRPN